MNYPTPRERHKSRNKVRPWIFNIREDYHFQSQHLGKSFDSYWLKLEPDGKVTVKANATGYAWDGCSPKWSLLGLWVVGTPDGHIDVNTDKPLTYVASMIHDVFYQYLEDVPVSKADIDRQFYHTLRKRGFPLAWLYYLAVRLFGGWGVVQKNAA